MSKIVSAVHHVPQPERGAQYAKSHLEQTARELQKSPGFLSSRLLYPIGPEDGYALLTFWQSRKHYRAAVQQQ